MRTLLGALLLATISLGCDAVTPVLAPPSDPPPRLQPSARNTQLTASPHPGKLSGRVRWDGPPPPLVPPHALTVRSPRPRSDGSFEWIVRPPPNFPAIDPANGGLAGAAVFLRGIDPHAARSWDHPPVTIELHDERPMVHQGDGPLRSIGFVHRGDAITLVSHQSLYHTLRAEGADFWSLTFPDADRPRTRRLTESGLVELTSGTGYYWMHAYLWVSEHSYFALTDTGGRWELSGVPPGEYELVVWHPNWRVERLERDPESGNVVRAYFRQPVEQVRRVTVQEGETVVDEMRIGLATGAPSAADSR